MFGRSNALTRTVSSESEDDGPTFPLFLLPSLSFSFRRQRRRASSSAQSSSSQPRRVPGADTDSEYYDNQSPVPSLSSSPASATDYSSPTSPRSLKSFFPELPSLNQLRAFTSSDKSEKKQGALPSDAPRLGRIQPDTLRCNTCSTDIAFCSQIVSKGFTGRHGRAYLVSAPTARGTPSCPASPLNKTNNPKNTKAGSDVDLVNIRVGRPENRQLVTGQHVVADISCIVCGSKLGWKYVDAREQAQKYKVGKFILETQRVVAFHSWENIDEEDVSTITPTQSQQNPVENRNTPQSISALNEENLNTLNASNRGQTSRLSNPSRSSPLSESQGSASTSTSTTNSRNNSTSNIPQQTAAAQEEVIVFDSEDEDECDEIFAGIWDAEVVAKRRRHKVSNIRRNGGAST